MSRRVAKSWEELRALAGFREKIDKAEVSGAKIVGDYEMPASTQMQPCAICQCGTKHRRGYIIELADDSVSHVGGDCGKKHFGTATWKSRLRRYRDEKKADAADSALADLRRRAASILENGPIRPLALDLVRIRFAEFDLLPVDIRSSLEARAQDLDADVNVWRAPTDREVREAKFHGQPRPGQVKQVVGRFRGLDSLVSSRRADYLWEKVIPARIEAIRGAMGGDILNISSSISEYEKSLELLNKSIRSAHIFFQRENLELIGKLEVARRLNVLNVTVIDEPDYKILLRYRD